MEEPVVEPQPQPQPQPEPAPAQDEDEIRRALLLLVEQGIMTPEQARAAYRKQTR